MADVAGRQVPDGWSQQMVEAARIISEALQSVAMAQRDGIVTDAAHQADLRHLTELVASTPSMAKTGKGLGAFEEAAVDPREVVWRTVNREAVIAREQWAGLWMPHRDESWARHVAATQAVLQASGTPDSCRAEPGADLSPLPPLTKAQLQKKAEDAARMEERRRAQQRNWWVSIPGALAGAAIGYLVWPFVASIPGLRPTASLDLWWIMVMCVAMGGYAGFSVGDRSGR